MIELPHYTDPYYEAARQKRRYHTDPAYRLDRINRARKRAGLPPHETLGQARIIRPPAREECTFVPPMAARTRILRVPELRQL
jgi:hypothetical protein